MGLETKINKEFKKMKRFKKGVIIGDHHFPFEDKKTLDAVHKFLKTEKPDIVFIAGDLIDFYEISRFDKNPERKTNLQDEINTGKKELEYIRKLLPRAEIIYLEGNHDGERLRKLLWQNPEIASLKSLKLENLLGLKELKIKNVKYQEPFVYKGLYIHHGDKIRKHSAYTAKAYLDDLSNSGIVAHSHRLGGHYKTTLGKQMYFYENGCLCKLEQEYTKNPNWQQGFSVVYFDNSKKKNHQIYQVHVKDHEFVFNGKLYSPNKRKR